MSSTVEHYKSTGLALIEFAAESIDQHSIENEILSIGRVFFFCHEMIEVSVFTFREIVVRSD